MQSYCAKWLREAVRSRTIEFRNIHYNGYCILTLIGRITMDYEVKRPKTLRSSNGIVLVVQTHGFESCQGQ